MALGSRRYATANGVSVSVEQLAGPAAGGSRPTRQQRMVTLGFGSAAAQTNPAGADGIMTAAFPTVPGDRLWKINRINVSSTSTAQTAAVAYVGPVGPANRADFTKNGEGDVADEVQPIIVGAGTALTIQWTGASLSAVGTVVIQYEECAIVNTPV